MTQEEFFKRYTYDLDRDYLGGGGFGKVFKAFDNVRDRWVAIKIAEVKPGMEQLSLQKEVELSAQLPEHTNIAHYEACYRFRTPHGVFDYGILQYYSAGNLSELIKSKPLTLSQKESIAKGILEGIGHLHSHNIIHRDLKSSNILIAERSDHTYIPKITDFGLSKLLSDGNQSHFTNSFAGGSLLYVAPEQLAGQTIRRNVDLWSYGVILYELFNGKTPFYPEQSEINSESGRAEVVSKISIGKLPIEIEKIPEPWQGIVRNCLIADPQRRTGSVHELGRDLMAEPIVTAILLDTKKIGPYPNETIISPILNSGSEKHDQHNKSLSNQRLLTIVGFLVGGIVCLILYILLQEAPSWKTAVVSNTIESYQNYLKFYPLGTNAERARLLIDSLEFDTGIKMGKYSINEDLLKTIFKNEGFAGKGRTIEEFRKDIFNSDLQEAIFTNAGFAAKGISFKDFRKCLFYDPNNHKNNPPLWIKDYQALKEDKEDKDWQLVQSENTIAAYTRYIKDYPSGKNKIEANNRIKDLEGKALPKSILELEESMVWIEGSTFQMGCTSKTTDCDSIDEPVHTVSVSSFSISPFEVTQSQWRVVMGEDPLYLTFVGCDQCPVEGVSWNDIHIFLKKLNSLTTSSYRLPTEAEWEFAARGGKYSANREYSGSNNLNSVAWTYINSGDKTHIVGKKYPNEIGLYDMSGNVWEWVEDCQNGNYLGAPLNGAAWNSGNCTKAIVRGGCWSSDFDKQYRVFNRDSNPKNERNHGCGFRIAK